jgi:hemoglobin
MADIETDEDIKKLVDAFYVQVREDDLLNPIFADVAKVDWVQHLPKMYAFWNGMILGKSGYTGRPFPVHAVLPVVLEHFERWLAFFKLTVDANFAGVGADRAKNAAASIAHTFAMRMGLINPVAGQML